jgi:hypothetical protein
VRTALFKLNLSILLTYGLDQPSMGRPSKGILGKRRFPTADLDQNNQIQSSSDPGENPKPNKRVRFADIEDIPTSHVRTPIHRLVCQFSLNNSPL